MHHQQQQQQQMRLDIEHGNAHPVIVRAIVVDQEVPSSWQPSQNRLYGYPTDAAVDVPTRLSKTSPFACSISYTIIIFLVAVVITVIIVFIPMMVTRSDSSNNSHNNSDIFTKAPIPVVVSPSPTRVTFSPTISPTQKPTTSPETGSKLRSVPCYFIDLETSQNEYADSPGQFYIAGFGFIPDECKQSLGSKCTVGPICPYPNEQLEMMAFTDEAWVFKFPSDGFHFNAIGDCLDYFLVGRGCSTRNSPPNAKTTFTRISTEEDAFYQKYALQSQSNIMLPRYTSCASVTFTTTTSPTLDASSGEFYVAGYGKLPQECHQRSGGSCTIELCSFSENSLGEWMDVTVLSKSHDSWTFLASTPNNLIRPTADAARTPDSCKSTPDNNTGAVRSDNGVEAPATMSLAEGFMVLQFQVYAQPI